MSYQATITSKGQITIPKKIRELLGLRSSSKVIFEVKKEEVKIKPVVDILEIAGTFQPKKRVSALKLREKFEKEYERI